MNSVGYILPLYLPATISKMDIRLKLVQGTNHDPLALFFLYKGVFFRSYSGITSTLKMILEDIRDAQIKEFRQITTVNVLIQRKK